MLTTSQKKKIQDFYHFLIKWGVGHHRNFLWRNKPTPYCVLIAELFLQRTNADQAEKQYRLFLGKYKSFKALDHVTSRELKKILEPLGLHKRIKIFKKLIAVINRRYGGRIPDGYRELMGLPGIGDYTANAVLLFAHNQRRGLVDTNTIRIFSSLLKKKITREEGKHSTLIRECSEYFSSLGKDPKKSNWLLLDYGALINQKDIMSKKQPLQSNDKPNDSKKAINFETLMKEVDQLIDEEMWTLYAYTGLKLKERNLVRTRNIVGERGEFLAIKTYNETPGLAKLQAAPEGTQNVDALSRKGERYSIKTISEPGNLTGVFYGLGDQEVINPEKKFEFVVIVLIDKYYKPKKILEITWEQFLKFRRWHKTMRAWNLSLTKELFSETKIIFKE